MSPNKLSFVIVIMLMTSTCASAAIYNPRMQVDSNWISTTLCSVMSTPTLYDVNGDGYKEIIVAAASYVYIFDLNFKEVCKIKISGTEVNCSLPIAIVGRERISYSDANSGSLSISTFL